MTASRAGSATPTFKEEEEMAGNNSISEEVDNHHNTGIYSRYNTGI
jgi:hypothetical protein